MNEMSVDSRLTTREAISFCRVCTSACGMRLTISGDNRIVSMRADDRHPLSAGYACFKGLQAEESHHGPRRLLHSLKRMPDGSFRQIASEDAFDEISDKLRTIIDRHGPDAVAVFGGNGSNINTLAWSMQKTFLSALGSKQYFTSITIDQPAKAVSGGRMGSWVPGFVDFENMDMCLFFGVNPLVSHGAPGFLWLDPVKRLKRAKARGLKMAVIDPRRTETARHADLVLQPYPGEDAAIAGGIIRIMLEEGWEDRDFCDRFVDPDSMQRLRQAVAPLTEDYVEARAGLAPGQLRQVAEMFGRDSRNGAVWAGTGPDMAPFSNLAQQMIDCLNVVGGRFLRVGDRVHAIDAIMKRGPIREGVYPPMRAWEAGGPSRIRGVNNFNGERLSGTLADEILTPGEGQIRAVIVDGGNPLTSLPDQYRAAEAFRSLDLLVSIDPWETPTTRLAHYVIPPLMPYERPDLHTHFLPGYAFYPGAWGQYTPAVLPPPEGSDVVNDWYVFWSICRRLGRPMNYLGRMELGFDVAPSEDELLNAYLADAQYSLNDLKANPLGMLPEIENALVQPQAEGDTGRFDVMAPDVAAEMKAYLSQHRTPGKWQRDGKTFSHLLSTRRHRDFFNSNGTSLRTVLKRAPYNPAYVHPAELEQLGAREGDVVEIVSAHGKVRAVLAGDPDLRPGVVSMSHGWGALPDEDDDPATSGACVNRLMDADRNFEDICAMPHMSAVPVNILRL